MRTFYRQTETNVCFVKTRVSAAFMCDGSQKVTATGARDTPNTWQKIDVSVGGGTVDSDGSYRSSWFMTYRNVESLAISSFIFYGDESRLQLLLSDLAGHFDSREIPLDPFLKIPTLFAEASYHPRINDSAKSKYPTRFASTRSRDQRRSREWNVLGNVKWSSLAPDLTSGLTSKPKWTGDIGYIRDCRCCFWHRTTSALWPDRSQLTWR